MIIDYFRSFIFANSFDNHFKKFLGVSLNYGIMEGQTNSVQALLDNNTDLSTKDINGDSLL